MPFVLDDRVLETSTTTGTGNIALLGAVTGFKSFSSALDTRTGVAIANGDTVPYSIEAVDANGTPTGNWETGIGTVTLPSTLARTTVFRSSNSNAAVNFAAGTKNVSITTLAHLTSILDSNKMLLLPSSVTAGNAVPSSMVGLQSVSIANHAKVAMRISNNSLAYIQEHMGHKRIHAWNPPGDVNTAPGVFGFVAMTAIGTATTRNTLAAVGAHNRMSVLGYPSAAVAGSLGGVRNPQAQFSSGSGSATPDGTGFYLVTRWVDNDPAVVAGVRRFIGLRAATTAPTNVEPDTLVNAIGVAQLSTDATQYYIISSGSAAQPATALGTAVGAPAGARTTAWELVLHAPTQTANTVYLRLTNLTTGATTGDITLTGTATSIVQSGTLLSYAAWCSNNATALACGIDQGPIYVVTDF